MAMAEDRTKRDPNGLGNPAPNGNKAEAKSESAVLHALNQAVPVVELPMTAGAPGNGEDDPLTDEDPLPPLDRKGLKLEPRREASREMPPVERVSYVLERKHPLAIRWMHWINFPVLFTMMWSGLLIYWNDSDNAYQHPHRIYRVGVGTWTLFRFFPDWLYAKLDVPYHVTQGLGYHFFFMWIFGLNGLAYVLYLVWSREWKFMVPTRDSIREAIQVTLVDLHLRKGLPAQTKYNGAQRIAYSGIILMGLGSLVTGLVIYKPTQAHWVTSLLGGYEMARWLHFWLTIGFCMFFVVHVVQVAMAGWNNFRSMVSGYEIRRADEPSLEAERRKF
jgi:thiosulfate reductase cytochrome b subunit